MSEKTYEEVEILKKHFEGKYEFLELIGKGGFALVYKVRDLYLERLGAIKILYKEYSRDEETIERFRREAKIYANLEHPNIVPIYDIGIVQGIVFFIMKFIEGETLNKIIRKEGKLPEKRAIKIISDLLDALAYIHKKGIIHRDIKPHNIMIDKTERTILADFGIARTLESTSFTKSGAILGTAYYLSPEQAKGLPIDHRVDIYSAGVTLYEMVTGELPFKGENTLMVLYQHVNELPPLPTKINPSLSSEMEKVVLKALEKNPQNRFSCAEEMREALQKIPIEPKKVITPEPLETIEIPEEVILKKTPPKKVESLEFQKFKTAPSYSESVVKKSKTPLFIALPLLLIYLILLSFIFIPSLRNIFSSRAPSEKEITQTQKSNEISPPQQTIEPSLKDESISQKEIPEEKAIVAPEPKKEEKKSEEITEKPTPPKEELKPPEQSKIEIPSPVQPSKGALVLSSSHPCIVVIDEKYQYELPPRRTLELPTGMHHVRFVIEGYEAYSYEVEVVGDKVHPIHHRFTPFGKLMINVIPWGNVKIDDKDFGPSPIETKVPQGEHVVTVKREGYKTITKVVKIISGKTEILNLKLEKEKR